MAAATDAGSIVEARQLELVSERIGEHVALSVRMLGDVDHHLRAQLERALFRGFQLRVRQLENRHAARASRRRILAQQAKVDVLAAELRPELRALAGS